MTMTMTTNRIRTVDAPMGVRIRGGRMVANDEAANMMIKTAETLVARARDAMFEVNKPLGAGPAPSAPDLGTLYDGTGGRRVPGSSDAELRKRIRAAMEGLTDAEISEIIAAMHFSGSQNSVVLGDAGVVRVSDAHRQIAAQAAEVDAVQKANDALWGKNLAEWDMHDYGRAR
jgi:hypothetical protein